MRKTVLRTPEKQHSKWKQIGWTGGRFAWFVGGVIMASIIGYPVNAILTHIWPITFGHLIIPNLTFIIVAIIITILLSILCLFLGAYLVVWLIGKWLAGFFANLTVNAMYLQCIWLTSANKKRALNPLKSRSCLRRLPGRTPVQN